MAIAATANSLSMGMDLAIEVELDGSTREFGPVVSAVANHCADAGCFAELVKARADEARTVILAMTNKGFVPFWHNLRCSLERLNVARHAIVVGTDMDACMAAASTSVPCVVGDSVLWDVASDSYERSSGSRLSQGATNHGTAAYARLMHVKARPALAVLQLGYDLIFTDTDVVWLQNPLRELRTPGSGTSDYNVLIQSDYDESNDAKCSRNEHCRRSTWCDHSTGKCAPEVCGGFYLIRAEAPSIALLEALFARMAWQRDHVDERIGEQPALNFVLRRTPGVRYRVLPRAQYPNGNAYFLRAVWPPPTTLPVLVHANWITGADAKRERLEQFGLWLLGSAGDRTWTCAALAVAPAAATHSASMLQTSII